MGKDEKVEPDKGDVEVFMWIRDKGVRDKGRIPYKIKQMDLGKIPNLECLKGGKSPEDRREMLAGRVVRQDKLGFLSYEFERKGIFGREEYWILRKGIEINFRDVDTYEKFMEIYKQLGFSKS